MQGELILPATIPIYSDWSDISGGFVQVEMHMRPKRKKVKKMKTAATTTMAIKRTRARSRRRRYSVRSVAYAGKNFGGSRFWPAS